MAHGDRRNKLAHRRRRAAIETAARRKLGMPRLTYPTERQAVVARVIEERDYDEIAVASGATPAAIRQRVSRGLAKLARLGREER